MYAPLSLASSSLARPTWLSGFMSTLALQVTLSPEAMNKMGLLLIRLSGTAPGGTPPPSPRGDNVAKAGPLAVLGQLLFDGALEVLNPCTNH